MANGDKVEQRCFNDLSVDNNGERENVSLNTFWDQVCIKVFNDIL